MKVSQITESYGIGFNDGPSKYPDTKQGAIDCFTTVSLYDPEHVTKVYPDPYVEYVWAVHTKHPDYGSEKHVVYLKEEDFETDDRDGDTDFTVNESTTAGSIASVSMPLSTQKRKSVGKGVYDNQKPGNLLTGKKTNKKYANSVNETHSLKFKTVELLESQLSKYSVKFFENYGIEKHNQRFFSMLRKMKTGKIVESTGDNDISHFIETINKLGNKKEIKVGDFFSVLSFTINFNFNEVDVVGFTKPKEVKEIKTETDGTIRYIRFIDGSRYPKLTHATSGKKPVEYPAYFDGENAADQALMQLRLTLPDTWEMDTSAVNTPQERFGLKEGKMKQVADDMMNMDNGNFKKKYKKSKEELKQKLGDPKDLIKEYTGEVYRVQVTTKDGEVFTHSLKADNEEQALKKAYMRTYKNGHDDFDMKILGEGIFNKNKPKPLSKMSMDELSAELDKATKDKSMPRAGKGAGAWVGQKDRASEIRSEIYKRKQGKKPGMFTEDTLGEEEILSPDSKRRKTGLHKPGKEEKLSHFKRPFKSSGVHVSDSRGNKVCECENEDIAKEVSKALNDYVKMDENFITGNKNYKSGPGRHTTHGVAKAAWKNLKHFVEIPEKVSGHVEDLDNYFGLGPIHEAKGKRK
jgi:hypothetical protein